MLHSVVCCANRSRALLRAACIATLARRNCCCRLDSRVRTVGLGCCCACGFLILLPFRGGGCSLPPSGRRMEIVWMWVIVLDGISVNVPLDELPGGPVVVAEVGASVVVPCGLVGGGDVVLESACLSSTGMRVAVFAAAATRLALFLALSRSLSWSGFLTLVSFLPLLPSTSCQ